MKVRTREGTGLKYRIYYILITFVLFYLVLLLIPGFLFQTYLMLFGTIPFIIVVIFTLRFYLFAFASIRSKNIKARHMKGYPFVSIIVPAFNEATVLDRTISAMLKLDYPKDHIEFLYVYEPHCKDRTGEIIEHYAKKDPRIVPLLRPPGSPGGKAAPTNYGIRHAKGKIIGIFDADHSLNPDLVLKALEVFRDPKVGCVRGRCRTLNLETSLLSRIVAIERDTVERIGIYGSYRLGGFTNFGGGHGFFRSEVFKEVGMFDEEILCEDIDYTVRMYMKGYEIVFVPNMQSWEESPTTIRALWGQRKRWSRGWMQVCKRYFLSVPREKGITLSRKVDTMISLSTSVSSFITIFIFPLLLLTFIGYRTTLIDQVVSLPIWLFVSITPIIAGVFVWILDRDERPRPGMMQLFLSLFLLPYVFLQFLINWVAFMDEFILRRPYAYVKCERAADRFIPASRKVVEVKSEKSGPL